ncbi:nuclear transport factor 2 family protein [Halioxenophilus aromaticivorans]|uniref:SnoaL-like domain-containing protein n=1 Tax=Halioxenophilus aromaticivorans TaxID=1306992 RepID=A0AAV3TVW0_9ALTE
MKEQKQREQSIQTTRLKTIDTLLHGMTKGAVTPDIFTPSFTFWSNSSHQQNPLPAFLKAMQLLSTLTQNGMAYHRRAIIQQHERCVIEVESQATLTNGEPYANHHVFLLNFVGNKISSIREYMDCTIVAKSITPLLLPLLCN